MATRRAIATLVLLLFAGVLLAARPGGAEAQARGSLVGTVVDAGDGASLEGVTVSIANTDIDAQTDEEGKFLLPDVPVGQLTVRIENPGYSTVVEQVDISSTDISFLRVQLPRMEAMLRQLLVRSERRSSEGGAEVEIRRDDRDDSSKTAADLLAEQIPGVEVGQPQGIVGSGTGIRIRGVSSITQSNAPAIYLDGIRIDSGARPAPAGRNTVALHVLQTIAADEVERIRVLRGPSAAAKYADSANGVILVETRRGSSPDGGDGDGGG